MFFRCVKYLRNERGIWSVRCVMCSTIYIIFSQWSHDNASGVTFGPKQLLWLTGAHQLMNCPVCFCNTVCALHFICNTVCVLQFISNTVRALQCVCNTVCVLWAGSGKMRSISSTGPQTVNSLIYSTINISTWPHQQGKCIGDIFLEIGAVLREIWELFWMFRLL